jgi:hypothetical protein
LRFKFHLFRALDRCTEELILTESRPNLPSFAKAHFVVTICAGSFLLFLVQPMIARMALPRLGGAPAVWNSAMLVYQALLLGGYAYAHLLGRLTARHQAFVHVLLFGLAALFLPIHLSSAVPPPDASAFIWVPWLLLSSIGPIFFVVSAQAPLMQRWFALCGGGDPYPLYAASNLGSFGGLIAYPLLVEPMLDLKQQSWLWSGGYCVLALLIILCVAKLPRAPSAEHSEPIKKARTNAREVARWVILGAIPSGLMLSTSAHLTTDIVAMPLLWVLPLGLYLLSFSVAFSEKRGLANWIVARAPLILLAGGAATFVDSTERPIFFGSLGLTMLFVVSTALHTRLFDHRPKPELLTGFYLAMSFGGVLGGLFCALIAPLVFDWGYEHPLLIFAAACVLGGQPVFARLTALWSNPERARRLTIWIPLIALLLSLIANDLLWPSAPDTVERLCIGIIAVLSIATLGRRYSFALTLGALMLSLGGWTALALSNAEGARTRSYFGTYTVSTTDDNIRTLVHGTTIHGVQDLRPGKERIPTSYYAPLSGIGMAMNAVPTLFGDKARVGVVGLGAGTLACFSKPGQDWRFYEIDPVVAEIARNPAQFSFLSRCQPNVPIAIGDARLTLAMEKDAPLDLLAIDAFSSDAIPMHLLTKEAFETYRRRIGGHGLLLVHISNRYLDLEPVLAGEAGSGWHGVIRVYGVSDAEKADHFTSSIWVAMSPDKGVIERLQAESRYGGWRSLRAQADLKPWTDDYASILPLLKIGPKQPTLSTEIDRR